MKLRGSWAAIQSLLVVAALFAMVTETSFAQPPGRGGRQFGGRPGGGRPGARQSGQSARDGQADKALPQSAADQIPWRSIGPANMMGRITAIAVYEADPNIWWAASASGGLLKTVNNGNDFEHQFDDQATVSIGDVQVAQSDPNIVWVGTGESNPRNSVSWGDGVYKSTDGGKTWTNMGLKKIFQTGAIAIHPTNPDIVWVGALGRLWGPNEDRGLYKTTDGGKNWKKVLYVDDKTGVVDVQVNPKNPDELLVATYERKRDGFDGNDPEVRFGEGAGIYKSTDGGESFDEVTEGLPTGKMGRIGLDYFEADPNYVYAVVESEKIGTEPENFPYLGVRGENADAGARITQVTDDTAAAKAGLKTGDIVVSVDGRVIPSYEAMLEEVYKKQAGEEVKFVVVRDRELVDLKLELDKKPENARDTYFTGTLGGQGANRQDAQGPEGFEYGGVYMSDDGGSTWKRINSLNPRPMYYSNIQVDPVDRNYIYLCGTSLYKSNDGGETFSGDGGTDGIHVDHHALWLDKRDPRHMILGNDGGIYVTQDRMEHWDHFNHVAIAQFYHVGIDDRLNYNVYGGLQDNGSWGGPSRNDYDGIVNSDWFRVGGGDGFVTLADPNDPNQIYFESQNGGMGRIHLETGERGFIRPRERGYNFRFNWKTPFMLSPHNSKIHLAAGNYVFRSYDRGNNPQRISPEITNTEKGSGSAITESPREPGVIYAGTTDGAVWLTRDGGNSWQPLFYSPEEKKDDQKEEKEDEEESKGDESGTDESKDEGEAESKEGDESKESEADKPAADMQDAQRSPSDKPADEAGEEAESGDPVTGTWNVEFLDERFGQRGGQPRLKLELEGDRVTGTITGRREDQAISEGRFDADTGKVSFKVTFGRGEMEYAAEIKDGQMTGKMSGGNGRFEIDFKAKKVGDDDGDGGAASDPVDPQELLNDPRLASAFGLLMLPGQLDDPISGTWEGSLENENLPDGSLTFTMELKLDDKNKISGTISSPQGDLKVYQGAYNSETKRVILNADSDQLQVELAGSLEGDSISGTIYVTEPALEIDFTVKRTKAAVQETEASEATASDRPVRQRDRGRNMEAGDRSQDRNAEGGRGRGRGRGDQQTDRPQRGRQMDRQEGQASDPPRRRGGEQETEQAQSDDPVTGVWSGTMSMRGQDREISLILKRDDKNAVTGTIDMAFGDFAITSGAFKPDSKELSVSAEIRQQFTFSVAGKVAGEQFNAKISLGDQDPVESVLKRTSKSTEAKPEADEPEIIKEAPKGEGSLQAQMPGPRWVSSLEASRFSSGRCYVTFDGHRSDDDKSYAFVTEDYGQTWKSLTTNLPETAGSVRVLREDLINENLLYLGCEFSAWWSIDRGQTWTKIENLPTVAVHEFALSRKAGEVVAGTHGRALWIADVSILRQLSKESLAEQVRLYNVKDVYRRQRKPERGDSGTRRFVGENGSDDAVIGYSLGQNARSVSLKIYDINGDEIYEFEEPERSRGLHLVNWNQRQSGGTGRRAPTVPVGIYRVELRVDGEIRTRTLKIDYDPEMPASARAAMEAVTELDEIERLVGESMIED